jgi:hypothetical protein
LKGIDNDRFNLIMNANSRLDPEKQLVFYFCHASLVIEAYDVSGYYNESGRINPKHKFIWEENERTSELKGTKKIQLTR